MTINSIYGQVRAERIIEVPTKVGTVITAVFPDEGKAGIVGYLSAGGSDCGARYTHNLIGGAAPSPTEIAEYAAERGFVPPLAEARRMVVE